MKQEMPQIGTKEFNDLASAYFGGKPRQETIEEAAEKFAKKFGSEIDSTRYYAFINGAKWQQEKMYSEEEVKKLIELHSDFIYSKIDYEGINNATTAISNPEWNDEEWFEQFKNKYDMEIKPIPKDQKFIIRDVSPAKKLDVQGEDLEEIKNIRLWLKDRKKQFKKK